jgi:Flp pilus assembly protein TadD
LRARILATQGQLEDAYDELLKSVHLNARNAMTHVALSDVCAQLGRMPEAFSWCQSAIELNPSYLPARFNLALFTLKNGDVDGAAKLTRELERLAPGHPRVALLKTELAKFGR